MTDKAIPDHESIERVFKTHPNEVIARLPDCIESREAKRLVPIIESLVHQARERHRDVPED